MLIIVKKKVSELVSRLKILFAHLLKWQYQPIYRCSSWQGSIVEQRSQLNDLIKANPGLKPYLSEAVTLAYPDAVELACEETGLLATTFPKVCPYLPEQALVKGFYPED